MNNKIKIIDKESKNSLFECALQESHLAYKAMEEFEGYGLDVEWIGPSISETLGKALGSTEEELGDLRQSMQEEMDDHLGSCCIEGPGEEAHKES